MFTLGNKEAIVNSTTAFPFTPAVADVDLLNIRGFGTFSQAKVTAAIGQRPMAAQLAKLTFTCPTAAAMGIATADVGVPVIVHLRVNTTRTESENAIDFIKRGRPMILEINVNGGSTAAAVAILVKAAFDEYVTKFPNATLPITAAISTADIILTATAGHYSILDNVTFLVRHEDFPVTAVTTANYDTGIVVNDLAIAGSDTTLILDGVAGLSVGDTIQFATTPTIDHVITEIVTSSLTITFTPALVLAGDVVNADVVTKTQYGVEAVNTGKYLEENVRMSTGFTSDAYAINQGQVPIIGGTYTMISFTTTETSAVTGWAAHKAVDADISPILTFTLYFNNDLVDNATGQVKYLVDWLVVGAPVIGDFKKANGASAVTTADFYA